MITTRRAALIERKDALAASLRADVEAMPNEVDRKGFSQAVELGNLLADILIDIAHPVTDAPS